MQASVASEDRQDDRGLFDEETGAYRPEVFSHLVEREVKRALRYREFLVILALDLGEYLRRLPDPPAILRLVVGQSAILTVIALAVGAAGAFALTRFLNTLLFGVTAHDPATLVAVAALMAAVALAATAIPAWRAARTDPALALRSE